MTMEGALMKFPSKPILLPLNSVVLDSKLSTDLWPMLFNGTQCACHHSWQASGDSSSIPSSCLSSISDLGVIPPWDPLPPYILIDSLFWHSVLNSNTSTSNRASLAFLIKFHPRLFLSYHPALFFFLIAFITLRNHLNYLLTIYLVLISLLWI